VKLSWYEYVIRAGLFSGPVPSLCFLCFPVADVIRLFRSHCSKHDFDAGEQASVIPQSATAKYLGLHLDSRLTWTSIYAEKKKEKR
jgi:hypothetical protein